MPRDLIGAHPNFRLGASIASGAYGVVYACYSNGKITSPDIALKLFIDGDDLPKDVLCELIMLQKLKGQHPNIISIYEVEIYYYLGNRHIGLTMPFYDTNLCHVILHHPDIYDKLRENAQIAIDGLIDAVRHIHSHCIIHRDIKAENILVRGTELVISDFGSAIFCKPEQTLTFRGEKKKGLRVEPAFGTELYYAPEVLHGKCGAPSDVWSLGVTIYQFNVHDLIEADSDEDAIKKLSALTGNIHRDIPYQDFFAIDPAKRYKLASGIIGGSEFDSTTYAKYLQAKTGKSMKVCKGMAEKIFNPDERKSKTVGEEFEIIEMLNCQLYI